MRFMVLCLITVAAACSERRSQDQTQSPAQRDSQALSPAQRDSQILATSPVLLGRPIGELIDSLRSLRGNFRRQLAIGSFDGQIRLSQAILAHGDSAVAPLVECMSRHDSTGVTWQDVPLSLGAVCYAMLRNLVIYEPPNEESWPGAIRRPPITDAVLAAAQAAWRDVVKRRLYGLS